MKVKIILHRLNLVLHSNNAADIISKKIGNITLKTETFIYKSTKVKTPQLEIVEFKIK